MKATRNKVVLMLVLLVSIAAAVSASAQTPRFRNAASAQRYYSAMRESQYWRSEQARYEAQAESLRRSDRFFRPIRRVSDAAFAVASRRLGPVYGPVVNAAYRRGVNYIRRGRH